MRYFYLDKTFKPFGEGAEVIHDASTFKGGEEHIRIKNLRIDKQEVTIVTRCNSSSDVMRILMANDALKRVGGVEKIHLYMPYLPYARQDKVMVDGEALSCKVFADLINSCGFSSVTVLDPHSDVGVGMLNNVKIQKDVYYEFVGKAFANIGSIGNPCVVSPDSGAYKKIFKTCEGIGFQGDIVLCNKARNLVTGEIAKLTVTGDVKDRSCIIIDDICDGGRTFAEVAKQLKELGAKAVYLIVTHGIFSYGEEQLKPDINHIWSTNSFREFDSEFITFVKL